ncbi:MAG TPA: HAD family phosphatase [Steroidobacteraceae bacterium]|nr:HAD family phosphatase [Steroidobacteraceae bacterium]
MSRPAIRNVVFDIGWVLVRLDYSPMLQLFRSHGVEAQSLHAVLARAALEEHESGRLSGLGLLERLCSLTGGAVSLERMHRFWVGMFELEPGMVDLAHRLSEAHRVYLLSNIGDLHWAHLSREYCMQRIGHGALPSFLAGIMKPHAGIYLEAERRFALEPAHTVFIDDRADNIATARSRGWHGIVHQGYENTVRALRGLDVSC